MAKLTYTIPPRLQRSMLDIELTLKSSTYGVGLPPLPMKVIGFWLLSIMALFWLLSQSYLAYAGLGWKVFIGIWWLIATAYFGTYTKAKEMKFMLIMPMAEYFMKGARRLVTRRNSKPGGFYAMLGIKTVDDKTGTVYFTDGAVGQFYKIVGSASILLFDADRDEILNRNDLFWRKVEPGVEYAFITTKEPQRVHSQVVALERRNRAITGKARDPELCLLMNEAYENLVNHVGGSFYSIHQYMMIRCKNIEQLRKAHAHVMGEATDSSYMFKQIIVLGDEDITRLLRTIYATDKS